MLADELNGNCGCASLVERLDPDLDRPILPILHHYAPRLTAYLAILDVLLRGSAARIERDLDRFIAVRAIDGSGCLRGPIAKRKVSIQRVFFVG
jgi:hypothetical protein